MKYLFLISLWMKEQISNWLEVPNKSTGLRPMCWWSLKKQCKWLDSILFMILDNVWRHSTCHIQTTACLYPYQLLLKPLHFCSTKCEWHLDLLITIMHYNCNLWKILQSGIYIYIYIYHFVITFPLISCKQTHCVMWICKIKLGPTSYKSH